MKDTFTLRLALFLAWPVIWSICLPLMALAVVIAWPFIFSKHFKLTVGGKELQK